MLEITDSSHLTDLSHFAELSDEQAASITDCLTHLCECMVNQGWQDKERMRENQIM